VSDFFAIDAGKLRRRIQIQANTVTQSDLGQPVDSFATVATRWASIVPASGQAFAATDQVRNDTTHKVILRYYPGLTPRHRIVYGSRVFNILSVLDEEEMHVQHTLLVQEVL
jgi:SPP1 family predicted phage head-tail adaptor